MLRKLEDFDLASLEARCLARYLAEGGTIENLYGPPMNPADRAKWKARNFLKNYGIDGKMKGTKL